MRKLYPIMAAALVVSQSILPVSAAEQWEVPFSDIGTGTTRETQVLYQDALDTINCSVTIPKTVVLEKATKSQTYQITAKGNLNVETVLKVYPVDASSGTEITDFSMHRTDKSVSDVTATISQPEKEWTNDEVTPTGTSKEGTIAAPDITPGTWEGTVTFHIGLYDTITGDPIDGSGSGSNTSICDKNDLSDPNHNWSNGICGNCGAVDESNHTHAYVDEIVTEATCTTPGEMKHICACGDFTTEEIPPAHKFVDGVCTECGEKQSTEDGLFDSTGAQVASWSTLVEDYGLDINTSGSLKSVLESNADLSTGVKLVLPNDMTTLKNGAFFNVSQLTDVVLPESLEVLENGALCNIPNITSLRIPASVTDLGSGLTIAGAFCNNLTEYVVDENNANYSSIDGVLYDKNGTKLLHYPAGKVVDEFTPADTCTSIGSNAFGQIPKGKGFKTFVFNNITSADAHAFASCYSLIGVSTYGSKITTLPASMFNNCQNLKWADLSGVTKMNGATFKDCASLMRVYFNGKPSYGTMEFAGCTKLAIATSLSSNPFDDTVLYPGTGTENKIGVATNTTRTSWVGVVKAICEDPSEYGSYGQ